MSPDEIHNRFVNEIEKRGNDDRYIDGLEERELMQIAIQHGFSPDWARQALTEVCQQKGFIIEAAVVQRVRERLKATVFPDGQLDKQGFESLVSEVRTVLQGTTRTDPEIRRLVVNTIDDLGTIRVKTGWFRNWYLQLKRQLRMT